MMLHVLSLSAVAPLLRGALLVLLFIGATVAGVAGEASRLPGGERVLSHTRYGDAHYYGTSKGVLRRMDHHEEDEVETVWNGGDARIIVRGDLAVIASGNQLLTGAADDPASWQVLPPSAFGKVPTGRWRELYNTPSMAVAISDAIYLSADGKSWQPAQADGLAAEAVSPGERTWAVVRRADNHFYLGRSEDRQNWEWSKLPQGFIPDRSVFPVLEDTAIISGSVNPRKAGEPVRQALVSCKWKAGGKPQMRLAIAAAQGGNLPIRLWDSGEGSVWARLPGGDVAVTTNGFNWFTVARQPLGDGVSWFTGQDSLRAPAFMLAAPDGRFVFFHYNGAEAAASGGTAVAWQSVEGGAVTIEPLPQIASLPTRLPRQALHNFVQHGERLFIGGFDKDAGLWAAEPGAEFRPFALKGKQVSSRMAALGGELLVIAEYSSKLVRIDAESGEVLGYVPLPEGAGGWSWVDVAGGEFFAGTVGNTQSLLRRAPGQEQWTTYAMPTYTRGVVKFGERYYFPSALQGVVSTADFSNWQYAPLQGGYKGIEHLRAAGGLLFLADSISDFKNGTSEIVLFVSADGENWRQVSGLPADFTSPSFRDIAYDGKRHWLLYDGVAFVSEDGRAERWSPVHLNGKQAKAEIWPLPDGRVARYTGGALSAFSEGQTIETGPAVAVALATPPGQPARALTPALLAQVEADAKALEAQRQAVAQKRKAEMADGPNTASGAAQVGRAFHRFERLYVGGASRSELLEQAQVVHRAVASSRPRMTEQVDIALAALIINLEPGDLHMAADLARTLPGFRKNLQRLYGKDYSSIYWKIRKNFDRNVPQSASEFEVDVMKELLHSYEDKKSYRRPIIYPKISSRYPRKNAGSPRQPLAMVTEGADLLDAARISENINNGWAGAALDRAMQHQRKLSVEASTPMQSLWLVAALAMWPDNTAPSEDALRAKSDEERMLAGSLFSAYRLAVAAHKEQDAAGFERYRTVSINFGMKPAAYGEKPAAQGRSVAAAAGGAGVGAGKPGPVVDMKAVLARASAGGSAEAQRLNEQGRQAAAAGQMDKAVTLWEKSATDGDAAAMYFLANALLLRGTQADAEAAVTWLEKSAAAGDAEAQKLLPGWADALTGYAVTAYQGQPQDIPTFRRLLGRSAGLGSSTAMLMLGTYLVGTGYSAADMQEGVALLQKAKAGNEPGIAEAVSTLAQALNASGQEMFGKREFTKAVTDWETAAALGEPGAMVLLVSLYSEPIEIEDDLDKAFYWIEQAEKNGRADDVRANRAKLEVRQQTGLRGRLKAYGIRSRKPLEMRLLEISRMVEAGDTRNYTAALTEDGQWDGYRTPDVQKMVHTAVARFKRGERDAGAFDMMNAATLGDREAMFLYGTYLLGDIASDDSLLNFNNGMTHLESAASVGYPPAVALFKKILPLEAQAAIELATVQATDGKEKPKQVRMQIEAMAKEVFSKEIDATAATMGTVKVQGQNQKWIDQLLTSGAQSFKAQQHDKALVQWEAAANLGSGRAMLLISNLYMNGLVGGKRDFDKARQWLQKSLDSGYEPAREHLKQLDELLRMLD